MISLPAALIRAIASRVSSITVAMWLGVGVNDGIVVACDRHMAFPENQVAALEFFRLSLIQRPAKAILLHVAVARAAGARGIQRDLDEAGTIDPKTAFAAPQIGRAGELLGYRDEVRHMTIDKARHVARGNTSPRASRRRSLFAPPP